MIRVALREIRAHLVRFVLSVLAVTLGIAFVTGTFSLRAMLADTFASIVASTTQGDVYVRGAEIGGGDDDAGAPTADGTADGGRAGAPGTEGQQPGGSGGGPFGPQRAPVDLEVVDRVAAVDGVRQAVPDLLGTVVLIGADGQAVVNGQAPSLGSVLREDDPSGTLLAGRAPRDAGEIALETTALETSGLRIGDTTRVIIGAGELTEVEVVGEAGYGNPMVGTTLVLVDAETGEAAFAPTGEVQSIAVFAEDGIDAADLRDAVSDAVADTDVQVTTGADVREEANETINQVVGFLGTFLLVFALISLFVGAFIISNTFAMSVRQRQREFALLRAVGASPAQVLVTVLAQAAVVGLIGSALGIAGGIGLIAVVRAWLASMDMDLAATVSVSPAEATAAVVLGTGISMVAAALPARRAAVTPPVEAMRDDVVVVERTLHWRAILGALVLVAGVVAAVVSVQEGTERPGTWLGAGAAAVLLGTLTVSPAIARATLGVLAWPFLALRPVGRLARGNVLRNPRRTANTAGALMIGMALVGATAVIAASAQASTSEIIDSESRADFWVQSATRSVPPDAVTRIGSLAEVDRADAVTTGRTTVTAGGASDSVSAVGVPAGAFGATLEAEVVAGSLDGFGDGGIAVNETAAVSRGWSVGDVLEIPGPDGTREVTVEAVLASQLLGAPVILEADDFDGAVPPAETGVIALLVDAAEGTAVEDLRTVLETTVEPYVVLTVQDEEELTSSFADQVDQAMVILYALLGLSVIIAVLGIVNTLALAVIERTREIGLMRAVGLGKAQLAATITVEAVLTAVFGTILGVTIGVGLASALPTIFAAEGLTRLDVPWDLLAGMVALSGVVGVVAALFPAWRATSMPVLEAVSYD